MKEQFKDRLKKAMELKGLKPVDICQRTDIPKSAISYYMAGKSEPKSDRLYIIARALDVEEAWLLGYDVPMERNITQKENDELADLIDRLKKEKDFRQLVIKLNHLKPELLSAVTKLIDPLS